MVSTLTCLIIFILFKGYKTKNIVLVFLLLLITDFLAFFYDFNVAVSMAITIPKASVYFVLLRDIIKKLKVNSFKKPISFFFMFIIILNISLVYRIVLDPSNNFTNSYSQILIFCVGMVIILLCTSAIIYNFRFNSKRSLLFVFVVFALALSDASWFVGYYMSTKAAFYFDILFYLISLNSMILYALETDTSDDFLPESISDF